MTIVPRLLIVDSVSTNVQEKNQLLGLTLLDKDASAKFPKLFPNYSPQNRNDTELRKVLRYAEGHSLDRIGESAASFSHRKHHHVDGEQYHLGYIVTEKEAFGFGYVEPHIDTAVMQIVDTLYGPRLNDRRVTEVLRAVKLIDPEQVVVRHNGMHIFRNEEVARRYRYDYDIIHVPINADHPIWINTFEPDKDQKIATGVSWYVQKSNTIYEFMAYVPIERNKK